MNQVLHTKVYWIFLSIILLLASCKNPEQAAYDELMTQGIPLLEGDTATAKIGEKLLFSYGFSSGVQDIHYLLTYHNFDETILKHEEYKEFFLSDEEVSGGHSEGVHIFTAKQTGLAQVVFYNPYQNADWYHQEAREGYVRKEDIIKDFCTAYQIPVIDTTWTEEQIEASNTAWLESFSELLDAKADSIMPIHAKRYTFQNDAQAVLDSLYGMVLIDKVGQWYDAQRDFISGLPIHPKTPIRTCFVQIKK